MKGRIIGIEPVDYASKKTGEQVKGVRLIIACKSQNVFGETAKEEFIKAESPIYKEYLEKPLGNDLDSLIGAEVMIDYEINKRGNFTFTDIVDFSLTIPKADKGKKETA